MQTVKAPDPQCGNCGGTGVYHFEGGGDVCACTRLRCDGVKDCLGPITHIDRKGYVYCQRHALRGRKLKPAELARLQSGAPLERY